MGETFVMKQCYKKKKKTHTHIQDCNFKYNATIRRVLSSHSCPSDVAHGSAMFCSFTQAYLVPHSIKFLPLVAAGACVGNTYTWSFLFGCI